MIGDRKNLINRRAGFVNPTSNLRRKPEKERMKNLINIFRNKTAEPYNLVALKFWLCVGVEDNGNTKIRVRNTRHFS